MKTAGLAGFLSRLCRLALTVGIVSLSACGTGDSDRDKDDLSSRGARVISLSPSTTEIMFDLGLEKRLIGVSRFCQLPSGYENIENIGGYLDPNYEKIAALKPDLLILLPEQEGVGRYLSGLGLKTLTIDNKTVEDILDGISVLGSAFGRKGRADSLVSSINSRIEGIRRSRQVTERPRVLISIGHDFGSGKAQEVYAAGKGTYYDQLLSIAGGENVCDNRMVSFPVMSSEGILSLDPDIVIELIPVAGMEDLTDEEIRAEWDCLAGIAAVRDNRVHIIRKEYSHIPGPRFILLLEEFAGILRN